MLVQVGESRSTEIDLRLAVTLSGIAGAINAAGLHAAGLFSANMTGNVSTLSDRLAVGDWMFAGVLAAVVIAFVSGAFTSGILIELGRSREIRGIYAYSIFLEGVLLAVFAVADLTLASGHSGPVLVLGLSFLMGLQNAATTMISGARVRTTHVSGMATDLGIELASLTRKLDAHRKASMRNLLRLHASTLAAFLIGGVGGAFAYLQFGGAALLAIAALLCLIALPYLRHRDKAER